MRCAFLSRVAVGLCTEFATLLLFYQTFLCHAASCGMLEGILLTPQRSLALRVLLRHRRARWRCASSCGTAALTRVDARWPAAARFRSPPGAPA